MDYYDFMCSIEHDNDSIRNISEVNIVDVKLCDNDVPSLDILKGSVGDVVELWDEESCDDFFLGADPYIPLY